MSFVGMLFVMAVACLFLGISNSSWGWAIGGVTFLCVGVFAFRQLNAEREDGPEAASNKFIILSLFLVAAGIACIAFLATAGG